LLNNGMEMPALGFGTWQSSPGEVGQAVSEALAAGYIHIDTAAVYGNEAEIGESIQKAFDKGIIKRENLFVTTKLWSTDWGRVEDALDESLRKLKLDYIDLYLVHNPLCYEYANGELFPGKKENGKATLGWVSVNQMWTQMEHLVESRKIRSIGVSNWPLLMVRDLLALAKIKPVINQIEIHPYFQEDGLAKFCTEFGVHVTAYSPLACGKDGPLNDPLVKQLADKHKVAPAQILIRYALDKGYSVLPKSVTPSRIRDNINVFHFKLNAEEIKSIDGLERGLRTCDQSYYSGWPFYA